MDRKVIEPFYILIFVIIFSCLLAGCTGNTGNTDTRANDSEADRTYILEEVPLEREGIKLHLEYLKLKGVEREKNILMIHGVTYSSHEFDINYQDYSLARRLAREGYCVWLLDIAGFGMSGKIDDGFRSDSDYAAEDIAAAVDKIVSETEQEKIDILGWSWGTVTVSRYVAAHPEHLNKLVLYAPILCGIGEYEIKEPFHQNTWDHAAEDFQRTEDGSFDYSMTDPIVIEMWCSSCWHFDGDTSPNGGRKDVCVSKEEKLINLKQITVPTLIICGSEDPYLNYDLVNTALEKLPKDSKLEMIQGGSHIVLVEKPYYQDFQDRLIRFLLG